MYFVKPCFLECNQGQEKNKCHKNLRYKGLNFGREERNVCLPKCFSWKRIGYKIMTIVMVAF